MAYVYTYVYACTCIIKAPTFFFSTLQIHFLLTSIRDFSTQNNFPFDAPLPLLLLLSASSFFQELCAPPRDVRVRQSKKEYFIPILVSEIGLVFFFFFFFKSKLIPSFSLKILSFSSIWFSPDSPMGINFLTFCKYFGMKGMKGSRKITSEYEKWEDGEERIIQLFNSVIFPRSFNLDHFHFEDGVATHRYLPFELFSLWLLFTVVT